MCQTHRRGELGLPSGHTHFPPIEAIGGSVAGLTEGGAFARQYIAAYGATGRINQTGLTFSTLRICLRWCVCVKRGSGGKREQFAPANVTLA